MSVDRIGLCRHCQHARRIVSVKDSEFWLCQKAASDPRFTRYPRLPVLACRGFSEGTPDAPPRADK